MGPGGDVLDAEEKDKVDRYNEVDNELIRLETFLFVKSQELKKTDVKPTVVDVITAQPVMAHPVPVSVPVLAQEAEPEEFPRVHHRPGTAAQARAAAQKRASAAKALSAYS